MEQYYGATIIFKTKHTTVTGILTQITSKHAFITDITNSHEHKIDIVDLQDLKILKLPLAPGANPKTTTTDPNSQLNNISAKSNTENIHQNVQNQSNTQSDQLKTRTDLSEYVVTKSIQKSIIRECFDYSGPSENIFTNIVAQNLCTNMLKIINLNTLIRIYIGENRLHAKIGYYVAWKMHNANYKVELNEKNINNKISLCYNACIERTMYINCGGIVTSFDKNHNQKFVLFLFDECMETNFKENCSRVYHCYDGYKPIDGCRNIVLGIGMVNEDVYNWDCESVYVVDAGIPGFVYDKFKVKRISEGCVTKIEIEKMM